MNPDTGHLMRLAEDEIIPQNYEEVPQYLNRAAMRKLNGKNEAYVSLNSNGKLSNWAKQKRKDKMSKNSKKQNRSK